jgi:heme oxygenase
VDAAFGGFDLADRTSYGAFLTAHARVLVPLERVLAGNSAIPNIQPRASLLADDLADLGLPLPDPLDVAFPETGAEAWAMLYVVEGSRLGGVMLARSVDPVLPRRYLSAAHPRGGWRTLLAGLDEAAKDEGWIDQAVPAARRVFDLYATSAGMSPR